VHARERYQPVGSIDHGLFDPHREWDALPRDPASCVSTAFPFLPRESACERDVIPDFLTCSTFYLGAGYQLLKPIYR
jgi:hypothetical protein